MRKCGGSELTQDRLCESENESPKIYELLTVTYDTVSAPYLVQITLTQLSMEEEANFPISASFRFKKTFERCPLWCCNAKLVKRVVAALKLETAKIYLWLNSMIVFAWLRIEQMELKTFVQNRVAKIQEHYPNQLWRHVPSDQNPADLVSRGVDPDKLLQQKLWFNGPTFLSDDDYPTRTINCRDKQNEYNSELKC
ncbi:uncharacterized protein TNCV_4027051 [Trichonephila clavipes]|nr:uncharacterized protein TNCV_4027051 [Trichonephila clavipes]